MRFDVITLFPELFEAFLKVGMMAEPLKRALTSIQIQRNDSAPVVLFSPIGTPLNHAEVAHWSSSAGAVLVCGRYEGIDQRFIDTHVDFQVSLGDFVLSGGEIAAMALLDAVARLQPGVLSDEDSHHLDSFNPALDGLLDCGHYTRPEVWQEQSVPAVLMSGHHEKIEQWRRGQRLQMTAQFRPDVLKSVREKGALSAADEALLIKAAQKLL
jgi:tRNA (guanine37-N1)-methyltransferase